MDSIGGMLNPFGKMPKTHYKKRLMLYNGILMETIEISVMVSIGLLLFFLAGELLHECTTRKQMKH